MDLSFFKDGIKECIRRKKHEFEKAGNVHFALIKHLFYYFGGLRGTITGYGYFVYCYGK